MKYSHPSMTRRHFTKLLGASATATTFSVAGVSPAVSKTAAKLPIRISFNSNSFVRLAAARELGLYEKYGLEPEFIRFQSGVASSAAFRQGGVDIGFTGMPGVTSMQLNQSNVEVFLTEVDDSAAQILVSQPEIKSLKGLVGKTVGTAVGTTSYIGLHTILNASGIDPASIEIINLKPNTWIPGYESKSVDAIMCWAPYNFRMLGSGGTRLATLSDFDPSLIFWIGRADFLASPDGLEAASRFIAAMEEADRIWEQSKDQVLNYMAEVDGLTLDVTIQAVNAMNNLSYEDQLNADYQWSLTSPENGLAPFMEEQITFLLEQGIFNEKPAYLFNADPLAGAMVQTAQK